MAVATWSGSRRTPAQYGFSLIEVLVALAIFAVLASTIAFQTGAYSEQLFRLEEKSLALWVAQNALDTRRIEGAAGGVSNRSQEVEMGGRTWVVSERMSDTNRPGFRRIDIEVGREGEDGAQVSLTGFVARR